MRRTPFQKDNDKFKIKPRINSLKGKDEVAQRLFWVYLGYWGTFALWLIVSHNFIQPIFLLGAIMWIAGGFTALKIKPESANIARKTRFSMLSYIAGLMGFKLVSGIIVKTPVEIWEQIFGTDLEPAFTSTVMGFITTAFIVGMFMGFLTYIYYLFQVYMFHRAEKSTSEYMDILLRREEDK